MNECAKHIYSLDLGESYEANDWTICRVPGGWVFSRRIFSPPIKLYAAASPVVLESGYAIYVPYSAEFAKPGLHELVTNTPL